MKIVDVEQIIKDVKAAIDLIDKEKLDTSGRAELETMLKLLESAPEVTDINAGGTISRQAAVIALSHNKTGDDDADVVIQHDIETLKNLPPAKRETATVSVGISKGGVTMWYECDACGEPVDQGDTFCSGCGRKLIYE